MASICNDDGASLSVMSGHERKTLRLSAINMATTLEIDAVIDPAETRAWLVRGMDSAAAASRGGGLPVASGARFVDTW